MNKRLSFLIVAAGLALAGAIAVAGIAPDFSSRDSGDAPVVARGNCVDNCG